MSENQTEGMSTLFFRQAGKMFKLAQFMDEQALEGEDSF